MFVKSHLWYFSQMIILTHQLEYSPPSEPKSFYDGLFQSTKKTGHFWAVVPSLEVKITAQIGQVTVGNDIHGKYWEALSWGWQLEVVPFLARNKTMFHAGVLESKPTTDSLLPDISFQLNDQIYGIRVYIYI